MGKGKNNKHKIDPAAGDAASSSSQSTPRDQQPQQQRQQQPQQQRQQQPQQQGQQQSWQQRQQQPPRAQHQPQQHQLQPVSEPGPSTASADSTPNKKPPSKRNKFKKADEPAPEAVPAAAASTAPAAATSGAVAASLASASIATTKSVAAAAAPTVDAGAATSAVVALPTAAGMKIAPNKGEGTSGRKLFVDVNYLAMDLSKIVPFIYHYDVTIEPPLPKRFMPQIFELFRQTNFPKTFVAFDGQKNAYAPCKLNLSAIKERQVNYKAPDEVRTGCYKVAMKEVQGGAGGIETKSLLTYQKTRQFDAPMRALQALEIVLKSVFLNIGGCVVGRSFFRPLRPAVDLGDHYDLWTGLFQSTVLGSQPYLNVDIAHKAFPRSGSLVAMLQDMRCNPAQGCDPRTATLLTTQLKGLRLHFERPGEPDSRRNAKFHDLGPPPTQIKFTDDKTKKQYTVAEYFQSKYRLTLKYPKLPCVLVHPPDKKLYMPMELCSVAPNQAVMKRCTEMQTRNMIKHAATSTDVRRRKVMDLLSEIRHNERPALKAFGVSVAADFTTVPARVLDAPQLEYKDRKMVRPVQGVWQPAGVFLRPCSVLDVWAVLIMDRRVYENQVLEMVNNISRMGNKNYNMQFADNPIIARLQSNRDQDIEAKMNELRRAGCKLLICIISNFGDDYARVKQNAEIRCGILTQCIKEATVTRKCGDMSTASNLLLKIHAKMNGVNHKLASTNLVPAQQNVAYMVVGADVTHPSPDQTRIPSVVGVASSYDPFAFHYSMNWRLQNPKQEMIQDLEGIMVDRLQHFRSRHKVLPAHLFYYRDGVSDGQFQEVMRVEYNAIMNAARKVDPNHKLKVVFMVVQKRHHTRFFPKPPNRGRDRNNNVEAGTIVDSQITHPNETQFFLVSHASIQGVAKPTKYCLLRDDVGMSINDLEAFTYNQCFMFTRCNRAVSYPAPTYYAHLAAFRGRVYIDGRQQINMDKLEHEYAQRKTHKDITTNHPMYFV